MSNQLVITSVGEVILLTAAQELSKQFVEYLRGIGLTDEEIRFLDKQGALFYWAIITDDYIAGKRRDSSYYLYNLTIFIAKLMIESIQDMTLRDEMKKFIEQQSVEMAVRIRNTIGNSVNSENINFIFEKMTEMLTQNDSNKRHD